MDRGSETQPQVVENLNKFTKQDLELILSHVCQSSYSHIKLDCLSAPLDLPLYINMIKGQPHVILTERVAWRIGKAPGRLVRHACVSGSNTTGPALSFQRNILVSSLSV